MDLVCVRELLLLLFLRKEFPFSGFPSYFEFRKGAELSRSGRKKPTQGSNMNFVLRN